MNFDKRGTSDGGFDGYNPDMSQYDDNNFKLDTSHGPVYLKTSDKTLHEDVIASSNAVLSAVTSALKDNNRCEYGDHVQILHACEVDKIPLNSIKADL